MPAEVARVDAPNMDVVLMLESVLAEARAGEIRAVGLVTVKRGAIVGTCWEGAPEGHLHNLNSGASTLAHRINSEVMR